MNFTYFNQAAALEPEAIAAMSKALEQACSMLRIRDSDARGREIVATPIVDLARAGIVGADALRDRVLLEAKSAA
jgi:hypothetical protein